MTEKTEVSRKTYYETMGLDPQLVVRYFRLLGPVNRVLDLGCGQGDLGRHRPDRNVEVFGLDNDRSAVEIASRYETAQAFDLESGRLPFPDGFFDGAVAKDLIEHLQRPWELVAELWRVLRPTRHVVVSVPMARPDVVWADYTHVRGFTAKAIGCLMEDFGFQVEAVERMGGMPLAGRLKLVDWIPLFLRLPGMCRLFGSSFEVLSTRRDRR